jgi:hypothetical protein
MGNGLADECHFSDYLVLCVSEGVPRRSSSFACELKIVGHFIRVVKHQPLDLG